MGKKISVSGLMLLTIVIMVPMLLLAEEPAKLEPLPFNIPPKEKQGNPPAIIQNQHFVTAANPNATDQMASKVSELEESIHQIKQNQPILEKMTALQDKVSDLNNRIGDNKQVGYDSQVNFLNWCVGITGVFLVILGLLGYSNIREMRRESKAFIDEAKIDIKKGLAEDYTRVIRSIFRKNYLSQINDLKVQMADLGGEIDKIRLEMKISKDANVAGDVVSSKNTPDEKGL